MDRQSREGGKQTDRAEREASRETGRQNPDEREISDKDRERERGGHISPF